MSIINPLNFIKKANRALNIFLQSHKKYDQHLIQYNMDQKKYKALLTTFIDAYGKNFDKIDQFLIRYDEHQGNIDNDFKKMFKSIEQARYYFYNGDEEAFQNIDTERLFNLCFYNKIQLLAHSPEENKLYFKTADGIILATNNRFHTIEELFTKGGYSIPQLYQFKEFVVFDVGMNRGYSALKFAHYPNCTKVHGFEIDKDTHNLAHENLCINPNLNGKIESHDYGLSDENGELDLYYLAGSDGLTTADRDFINNQSEWQQRKNQMKVKKGRVKAAGQVINDIIEKEEIKANIVLKIDTEGSEFKIINNLIDSGALDKVDIIMGEAHTDAEDLDKILNGFKNLYKKNHNHSIYSFCYVRPEYFKSWTPRES